VLETKHGSETFVGVALGALTVGRSWLRPTLEIRRHGTRRRLYGLDRSGASSLEHALRIALLRDQTKDFVALARTWHDDVRHEVARCHSERRWVTQEQVARFDSTRPVNTLPTSFSAADVREWTQGLPDSDRKVVEFRGVDLRAWITRVNESILTSELKDMSGFFESVERSPLTAEQSRAVVCFDNRVQVVAAAGSGKTSVMVARTAYALKRDLVPADRILLLAFNKDAAEELRSRVSTRLAAVGIRSEGVTVGTFHAFGLGLIGRATGRKPRLAPWLDGDGDVDTIIRIVDELRDQSDQFRYRWDIFRLLFARHTEDKAEHDWWDKATRTTGYRTLNDECVKSEGERVIADWLFLNGVDYRYEQPYSYDVADATHSQYRPDFYYPSVDVWHEHWALDEEGNPPTDFQGYAESMTWKRALHRQHGTSLIESTWGRIFRDDGLAELGQQLEAAGVRLDWNPDRPAPGARPIEHKELARLVRTFMTHVKSNSLTPSQIVQRVEALPTATSRARARWFLDLYWLIHEAWQERLRAEDCVDFEDMLVSAAEHLESGRVSADFDLVLVDEFQDVSRARARLVRALLNAPGRHLLAVGDDWQ
jgi:DNA helicase-4